MKSSTSISGSSSRLVAALSDSRLYRRADDLILISPKGCVIGLPRKHLPDCKRMITYLYDQATSSVEDTENKIRSGQHPIDDTIVLEFDETAKFE